GPRRRYRSLVGCIRRPVCAGSFRWHGTCARWRGGNGTNWSWRRNHRNRIRGVAFLLFLLGFLLLLNLLLLLVPACNRRCGRAKKLTGLSCPGLPPRTDAPPPARPRPSVALPALLFADPPRPWLTPRPLGVWSRLLLPPSSSLPPRPVEERQRPPQPCGAPLP